MSLEDEIKQLIYRSVATDPSAVEAAVTGESVDVDAMGMVQVLLTKINALETAVLLLAHEVDAQTAG